MSALSWLWRGAAIKNTRLAGHNQQCETPASAIAAISQIAKASRYTSS